MKQLQNSLATASFIQEEDSKRLQYFLTHTLTQPPRSNSLQPLDGTSKKEPVTFNSGK